MADVFGTSAQLNITTQPLCFVLSSFIQVFIVLEMYNFDEYLTSSTPGFSSCLLIETTTCTTRY